LFSVASWHSSSENVLFKAYSVLYGVADTSKQISLVCCLDSCFRDDKLEPL